MNMNDPFRTLLQSRSRLEAASSASARAVNVGEYLLCKVLTKYMFLFPSWDRLMGSHFAMNGYWESWTTVCLARHVGPGARVVNVGANAGYFTLLLADLIGEQGRIAAFEGNPAISNLPWENCFLNDRHKNLENFPLVVTDHDGTATFFVYALSSGNGTLIDDPQCAGNWAWRTRETKELACCKLDTALSHWDGIDLLFVDSDGGEALVVAGATELIKRSPTARLALEWNPHQYADTPGFIAMLYGTARHPLRVDYSGSLTVLSKEELTDGTVKLGDIVWWAPRL